MSIVEAMVALAILAITGSAIVLLLAQISSLNNSAKIKSQATSYAEQAMELVRGFDQNKGWGNLAAKGGYCYTDGSLTASTACISACGNGGSTILTPVYPASYTQSIKIITNSPQVNVFATVCWLDKGIWYKTESNTYFYDY